MVLSTVKSIFFIVLPYTAFAVFVLGLMWRLWTWARTMVPLRIPTTPAPKTVSGVVLRMLSEIVVFRSLFRDRKVLWLAALIFHVALLVVLIRHLRYVLYPVPGWMLLYQHVAAYAAYALLGSLFFLLLRHLWDEKDVYLLLLSDLFAVALLIGIAGTGILMSHHSRVDLLAVKDYVLSLMALKPVVKRKGKRRKK